MLLYKQLLYLHIVKTRPARPDYIGTGGSGPGNIGILGIKSEKIILNHQQHAEFLRNYSIDMELCILKE